MFESALEMPGKGGPELLRMIRRPTPEPGPGQLRLRIRAAGVGATDLMVLAGNYGFAPKPPVVPGYEVAGVVEAVGASVERWKPGQRAAALTVHGGFADTIVRAATEFAPIPEAVSDIDAAAVILNHVSAWQMVHRVARVRSGDSALVTAAGGGVGTALLQQLRLAGVKTLGASSSRRHDVVSALGATPIDRHRGALERQVAALVPGGVDHAFDAVGFASIDACFRSLRRGGRLVAFGFMGGGGRRASFYGITLRYRRDPLPFHEDLARVFGQLERGLIDPLIDGAMPLADGAAALVRLAAGDVHGKLVLTPGAG